MNRMAWTSAVAVLALAMAWAPAAQAKKGVLNPRKTEEKASPSKAPATPAADPVREATRAAQAWLKLVDDGKYAESWKETGAQFQALEGQSSWVQRLTGVRTPFGKVASRAPGKAQAAKQIPGAPDGDYVILQFATSFQNKKSAFEVVTMSREKDGRWHAVGYWIR